MRSPWIRMALIQWLLSSWEEGETDTQRGMPWEHRDTGENSAWRQSEEGLKGGGHKPKGAADCQQPHNQATAWDRDQPEPGPWFQTSRLQNREGRNLSRATQFEVLCYGSWRKLMQMSGQGDLALWKRMQIKRTEESGGMSSPVKPFYLRHKLRVPLEDLEGKQNRNPETLIPKSDWVFTNTCCQGKQNWLILESSLPNRPVYKPIPKFQAFPSHPTMTGKQNAFLPRRKVD